MRATLLGGQLAAAARCQCCSSAFRRCWWPRSVTRCQTGARYGPATSATRCCYNCSAACSGSRGRSGCPARCSRSCRCARSTRRQALPATHLRGARLEPRLGHRGRRPRDRHPPGRQHRSGLGRPARGHRPIPACVATGQRHHARRSARQPAASRACRQQRGRYRRARNNGADPPSSSAPTHRSARACGRSRSTRWATRCDGATSGL